MGSSKTEINLRRLLAAAPQQENQAKLIHYVATLREQLAQLTGEGTPEGLPSISTSKAKDYSEKIEALAARIDSDPQVHSDMDIMAKNKLTTKENDFKGLDTGRFIYLLEALFTCVVVILIIFSNSACLDCVAIVCYGFLSVIYKAR